MTPLRMGENGQSMVIPWGESPEIHRFETVPQILKKPAGRGLRKGHLSDGCFSPFGWYSASTSDRFTRILPTT